MTIYDNTMQKNTNILDSHLNFLNTKTMVSRDPVSQCAVFCVFECSRTKYVISRKICLKELADSVKIGTFGEYIKS